MHDIKATGADRASQGERILQCVALDRLEPPVQGMSSPALALSGCANSVFVSPIGKAASKNVYDAFNAAIELGRHGQFRVCRKSNAKAVQLIRLKS